MSKYLELFNKLQSAAPQTKNSHVLIIDGTNTFLRVFSRVPALNENGDHVGGVVGFLRSVGALIRKELPTRCIVVFDGVGGSQRRRSIYPDYKGNRKNTTSFNRFAEFKDLQDEKESIKIQFSRIIQYLDCLPVDILTIDNIEADDTIAYLVNHFRQFDSRITISSTDRDFLQLVTDKVVVWNPIKKIHYNIEQIEKEFGLLKENYLIYRVLTGDASDNIPGVKGVGLKTLLKIFPELKNTKMEVVDILEECEKHQNDKAKIWNAIISHKSTIELNHKLMQLSINDFSGHAKLNIINKLDTKTPLLKQEFLKIFFEDGLHFIIKDPHDWLQQTFNRLDIYERKR